MHCGTWAEFECHMCGRGVCARHARYWPTTMVTGEPRDGDANGHIITCGSGKCQAKVPQEARQLAKTAFVRSAIVTDLTDAT
jgi:hypothetical protein